MPLPGSEDQAAEEVVEPISKTSDLDEAAVLYEKLMQLSISADHVCQTDVMTRIDESPQRVKER